MCTVGTAQPTEGWHVHARSRKQLPTLLDLGQHIPAHDIHIHTVQKLTRLLKHRLYVGTWSYTVATTHLHLGEHLDVHAPAGQPRLVDAAFNIEKVVGQPTVRNSYVAYAVDDVSKHAVIRVGIRQQGLVREVTDLYVTPLNAPVETLTAFSLSGKSALHYLFLALGLASFSTIVVALTLIARTKGLKRKWLWIVGALIGAGSFAIDWSTGAASVKPFSVQLLGAFAVQPGGLAAWQVGFGIPVVAVIFLMRRRFCVHK